MGFGKTLATLGALGILSAPAAAQATELEGMRTASAVTDAEQQVDTTDAATLFGFLAALLVVVVLASDDDDEAPVSP